MAKGNGLALTSPRYKAIEAVVSSRDGEAAMIHAVDAGKPALCGIDQILDSVIKDYGDHQTLKSAGSIVAERMRELGFEQLPQNKNCEGCIAKEGAMWKRKEL